jgi:hypothetical protein
MINGRVSYSNWLPKVTAWHLLYIHKGLTEDEWIGIEEKGRVLQIVQRGPWQNPDERDQ